MCVGVFDIGNQPGFKPGDQPSHKVVLAWEIDKTDTKGKRFTIFDNLAAWLSTKPSKFSERVGALVGRPLTEQECKDGVDDALFVGKTAMVFIVPPSKEGKWPKIDRALPLQQGMSPMPPSAMLTEANVPKLIVTMRGKAVGGWKPPTPTPPNKSAVAGTQGGALPSREPGDDTDTIAREKAGDIPF